MSGSKEAFVIETASAAETIAAGEKLAQLLPVKGLVLLAGNLGAGKTTLVKGLAWARAGCSPSEVTSPTFTLIHEYGTPPSIYHIDLYRLENQAQAQALGIEDLLEEDALTVIEWGEKFPDLWPRDPIKIAIELQGEHRRRIEVTFPRVCQE